MIHIYIYIYIYIFNFKLFYIAKWFCLQSSQLRTLTHTLYFDHPIEKLNYIRLLSTSLYNSWNNLKEEAVISVADPNGITAKANLLPGHYTIDVLVNEFNNLNKTNPKFVLNAVANTPVSSMTIFTQNNVTSVRTAWD